jgi:hypothetical protein
LITSIISVHHSMLCWYPSVLFPLILVGSRKSREEFVKSFTLNYVDWLRQL